MATPGDAVTADAVAVDEPADGTGPAAMTRLGATPTSVITALSAAAGRSVV
ncbi:hypothetical protein [Nocardia aurantia]|uniref:hypothetical protein n=1 Tax=Nocardia aurantia TaxID=2585199 RepID=UPI001885E406|nr:hypothetical protein [Nocardia aurantia]